MFEVIIEVTTFMSADAGTLASINIAATAERVLRKDMVCRALETLEGFLQVRVLLAIPATNASLFSARKFPTDVKQRLHVDDICIVSSNPDIHDVQRCGHGRLSRVGANKVFV